MWINTHQRKSWKRALVVPGGSHSGSGAPQEKLSNCHCQNSEDHKRRLPLIMFDFENKESANTKSEHKNELLPSNFQVLFFGPIDEKEKKIWFGENLRRQMRKRKLLWNEKPFKCVSFLSRAWKSSLWALNYTLGNLIPAMTKEFPNVSPFIMKFASLFLGIWQQIFPIGQQNQPLHSGGFAERRRLAELEMTWFGIKWGDIKKSNTMNTFSGPKSESRLSSSPVPEDTTGLKR